MTVINPVDLRLDVLVDLLAGWRFTWRDEDQLQAAIAEIVAGAGLPVEREVRLTDADRIDLLVDTAWHDAIGIEVKVAGAASTVARQLQRYAHSHRIAGLLLVTGIARHTALPDSIGGKPLRVLFAGANL